MPRHVDHELRRNELAEVTARLIVRGGVEAANVRAIAQEAGYSTKVVSHYFPEKRALMLLTYQHAVGQSRDLTEASSVMGRVSPPFAKRFYRCLTCPVRTGRQLVQHAPRRRDAGRL